MGIYIDLRELKPLLEIEPDNNSEDKNLAFYSDYASSIIEEYCDRDFTYKGRTRVYKGTNSLKLVLKHRPVYPTPPAPYPALSVVWDNAAAAGFAPGAYLSSPNAIPLVFGVDYTIRRDLDDGGSREAILYKIGGVWERPYTRTAGLLSPMMGPDVNFSYQVTSTAGFTVDTLPGAFRLAANEIVARLRYIFPIAAELTGDSYEDKNITISASDKNYLLGLAKQHLMPYRNNWRF